MLISTKVVRSCFLLACLLGSALAATACSGGEAEGTPEDNDDDITNTVINAEDEVIERNGVSIEVPAGAWMTRAK